MTAMDTEGQPLPGMPRDRYMRPLVIPVQGGPRVPYTRCTTFIAAVDSHHALDKWKQRKVAVGLAERADLLLSVAAHRDDDRRLDDLCAQALDAGGGGAAATVGTALHTFTERMDRGLPLGVVPQEFRADLAAYETATAALRAVHIEAFTVYDPFRIGGTPDRIVEFQGGLFIADLKTGQRMDYGQVKVAAQLAAYSHSVLYDPATDERSVHGASKERGIVIHLPAGSGTCRLYWTDLRVGWKAVQIAREVRAIQGTRNTLTAIDDAPQAEAQAALVFDTTPSLAEQIAATTSRAQVVLLWRDHQDEWTPELTSLASARVAVLTA